MNIFQPFLNTVYSLIISGFLLVSGSLGIFKNNTETTIETNLASYTLKERQTPFHNPISHNEPLPDQDFFPLNDLPNDVLGPIINEIIPLIPPEASIRFFSSAAKRLASQTPLETIQKNVLQKRIDNARQLTEKITFDDKSTCVINQDQKPVCWIHYPSLVDSSLKFAPPPYLTPLRTISRAKNQFCGIDQNGRMLCWSNGFINDFASSMLNPHPHPIDEIKAMSLISDNLCLIISKSQESKPDHLQYRINSRTHYGQVQGTYHLNLNPNLGEEKTLSMNKNYICIITTEQKLNCWKINYRDELVQDIFSSGNIFAKSLHVGQLYTCIITPEGTPHCWDPYSSSYENGFVFPQELGAVISISSIQNAICVIRAKDGRPYCWSTLAPNPSLQPLPFAEKAGPLLAVISSSDGLSFCFIKKDKTFMYWGPQRF